MSLLGTVFGKEKTAAGHAHFKLEYVLQDTKSDHFRKKKRIRKMISSPNFNPHYKRVVIVFPCRGNGPDIAVALHRSVNGVFLKQWFFFNVSSCVWTAVELGLNRHVHKNNTLRVQRVVVMCFRVWTVGRLWYTHSGNVHLTGECVWVTRQRIQKRRGTKIILLLLFRRGCEMEAFILHKVDFFFLNSFAVTRCTA